MFREYKKTIPQYKLIFILRQKSMSMRNIWTGVTKSSSPLEWILKQLRQHSFRTSKIPDFSQFRIKIPWLFPISWNSQTFTNFEKFPDFSGFLQIPGPLATLIERKYLKVFSFWAQSSINFTKLTKNFQILSKHYRIQNIEFGFLAVICFSAIKRIIINWNLLHLSLKLTDH